MGNVLVNENYLYGIGNALREKYGTDKKYYPSEMESAVRGIQGGDGGGVSLKPLYDDYAAHNIAPALFNGCASLTSIDDYIEYEYTSNIKSMSSMFSGCSSLITVPLFDTSNVTNMASMFFRCGSLASVPLFNTGNVTTMYYMFRNCSSLTEIPLFDTSNVTTMVDMFNGCSSLITVPLFNMQNVTNMANMFYGCSSLITVPLFDTSNVTNMVSMFYNCKNISIIPSFNMQNVTSANNIFTSCYKLTECWIRNIKVNLQVGSGTSWGHLLTLESLLHLIGELVNVNESRTLTIGTANLEKIAGIYVKLIDITDEMRAEDSLIDSKLPFEVCDATDDGAMTIEDYALIKQWQIK